MSTTDSTRSELTALLGEDRVSWDDKALFDHAHDTWPLALVWIHHQKFAGRPACVVRPASTAEVARVLRYANERNVPVIPYGAGSGVCGGVLARGSEIVVDLRSMNRIFDLNETALTCRVQAGKMGDAFEKELNERGYSMGHFPQSIALSTVGGWVATRAAGQLSTRYGNIEDMLLGLEAVLADGTVVNVKSVPRRSAGPDPRHVFLGSEGTIGIVTEITVKVFPLPESSRRMCFAMPDFDSGLQAARLMMRAGWRPPLVRLYDAMETSRHFGQWAREDANFLLFASEGPAALAAAEAEACAEICRAVGGQPVGEEPVEHWYRERNNVPSLMSFVEKGFVLDTMEVSADWDRIHDVYREVIASVRQVKSVIVVSGHSSHSYPQGTNIYFTFVARPDDPADAEPAYRECWRRAMEATLRCGGSICHHHGIGRLRRDWMQQEHGESLRILRELKKALDPKGIMNPGVLLPPE